MDSSKAFQIAFSNVTLNEALTLIESLVRSKKKGFVVTPNVDHVVKLQKNPRYLAAYQNASLVLIDGMPLYWVLGMLGKPVKEKVSGSDLFVASLGFFEKKGFSVFFFGCTEEDNCKGVKRIRKKYPKLKIAGSYSPPMDFQKNEKETAKAIKIINKAKPDILYLFLGSPKSEVWINENHNLIKCKAALNLGASLDFVSGKYKRAPLWMQKSGMEWVWRMASDPKRLVKRYLIDDMFPFIHLTMKEVWAKWTRKS